MSLEPSIAVFWPPPPEETNVRRYQEIADLGADLVITGNYLDDPVILHHALSCADEVGLRVIVASDSRIDVLMRHLDMTSADAQALFSRVVDDYLPHPSFAGLGLLDEPEPDRFPHLAWAVDTLRRRAPHLLAYVNLLPSSATGPYEDYVGGFVETVDPAVLSFDRYPFLSGADDTTTSTTSPPSAGTRCAAGSPRGCTSRPSPTTPTGSRAPTSCSGR